MNISIAKTYWNWLLAAVLSAQFVSFAQAASPLPSLDEVEESEGLTIDGEWRLLANNTQMQIALGRAYSLDSWQHIYGFSVNPKDVLLKGIVQNEDGSFSGDDLPLSGRFVAKVQPNGELLFQVGWVFYRLAPQSLDDPDAYRELMLDQGMDPDSAPYFSKAEDVPEDGSIDEEDQPEDGEYADEEGEEELEENLEEEEEEEEESKLRLVKIKAITHDRVKPKRRTCKGRNFYLTGSSCFTCPQGFKRASLTRLMTHPQACQQRGLPKHKYVPAIHKGKARPVAGCPGKQNYRSKGQCYVCPKGFKRASVGRKMSHPKACQSRGLPKLKYTSAKKAFDLDLSPLACPSGQFQHSGYCKSCPKGTKRMHALGLDSGFCIGKK